uniref:Glycosyltransferase n=1 Tax=Linum usitatissimum TaxID=4006 RepID=I2BH35_LINUS|nr:UDP-glycosyltransferase 1 [Linum usitatissimum]
MAATEGKRLNIFFFPFMAHGHTIPMLDIANLFMNRGHISTIITTPLNAPSILSAISILGGSAGGGSVGIDIKVIKFQTPEGAELPSGCENTDFITSRKMGPEWIPKFFKATTFLRQELESLLQESQPDCLVADAFFPWATATAAKFGIPRLVFHGMGFFALSVLASLATDEPHRKVGSDSEPFLVPKLPDEIFLTRRQLPEAEKEEDEFLVSFFRDAKESEWKSFGVIVNSFCELEPTYVEHYRNTLGRKAWHIGPLSLSRQAYRGNEDSIEAHDCLKWLDWKAPDSVIYICFGSMANFEGSQLKEIAMALESCGQHFIWIVRKNDDDKEDWLPEGFEERTEGRGLVIRGWAPQVLILQHQAIGGFVTHCGWNSTLEGVTAGVPMVTWPVSAEQFLNEKLVTDVVKIGVRVGVEQGASYGGIVNSDAIEMAVRRLMVEDEGEEMRRRVKMLGKAAAEAVEGGSSWNDLDNLVLELQSLSPMNRCSLL